MKTTEAVQDAIVMVRQVSKRPIRQHGQQWLRRAELRTASNASENEGKAGETKAIMGASDGCGTMADAHTLQFHHDKK